ncbi:mechanosensitive ion channel family protein [Nocardioides sp. AX2bis]|uniref:mechanosensitive ion channel family protein n=1 Tax=Nocardioides sp. AX2bis TaxID=2653157 RepID=UPI0012F23D29|nr:transporter [Nocardioides sp. AX2bis]VXB67814.1 conserved membrane hypothetical protein [Nocardioides sp. AX2bis]
MDIGNSFENATDGVFAFIPNLLGSLLLLLIGYVIATVVAKVIKTLLDKLHLDHRLQESDAHSYVERVVPGASASNGISRVVFWLIFVFFISAAIGALGIPAVSTFMNQVLAYLPNVIVAILIFVIAALISGAAAAGAAKLLGDTPTGKIAATVIPALVMVIALFMILNQLQIAPEIVTIAFAATMGALALGTALAFGLGGKDVAGRILEDAYASSREAKERAKSDLQTGRARAEQQVDQLGDSSYQQGAYEQPGSYEQGYYDQGVETQRTQPVQSTDPGYDPYQQGR